MNREPIEHGEAPLAPQFIERKEPAVTIEARCCCGASCTVRSSYASAELERFVEMWRLEHEDCERRMP